MPWKFTATETVMIITTVGGILISLVATINQTEKLTDGQLKMKEEIIDTRNNATTAQDNEIQVMIDQLNLTIEKLKMQEAERNRLKLEALQANPTQAVP